MCKCNYVCYCKNSFFAKTPYFVINRISYKCLYNLEIPIYFFYKKVVSKVLTNIRDLVLRFSLCFSTTEKSVFSTAPIKELSHPRVAGKTRVIFFVTNKKRLRYIDSSINLIVLLVIFF